MQDGVWIILSGSCKFPFALADRICFPICHCEAPTGPWRPEREARGSALGVQSREGSCDFADGFPMIRHVPRDCHVGLLAMTNLGALRQKQCSACCKPPWRSPSAPKNTEAAPLSRRLPMISGEINKGQSSAWKFCPLRAAFPQRSGCPLPFGRVAHGRNK